MVDAFAVAVVTRADEAGPRAVRLDLAVSDGRLWTVRSDAPFDNETSVPAVPRWCRRPARAVRSRVDRAPIPGLAVEFDVSCSARPSRAPAPPRP
ncbi:MAG: hypothetical protein ACFNME_06755 [Actinomyces dentalis]